MFVEAFGLRRDPFMDTADPAFYYETLACANGRRRLTECLAAGRGLGAIVGPIGAGKTTLCNAVQSDVLSIPSCRAGLILDPSFRDEREFLAAAAAALGIEVGGDADAREIKDDFKTALFDTVASGSQFVLFLDEAQLLPEPLFESLRALLNFQVDERKLLAIALSGQMELAQSLRRHPGLSDRIALWLELGPLAQSEAAALLDHRLRCAGFSAAQSPFSPQSAMLLWQYAGGLPRRLTTLAREAMEVAAERGSREVRPTDVEAALKRTAPAPVPSPASGAIAANGDSATTVKPPWPWSLFAR